MIQRLVNGVVHDLRPLRLLSASPSMFVAAPSQETDESISPAERERVQKLIRLRVVGGHVSKTS